jgi:hypothetical protein
MFAGGCCSKIAEAEAAVSVNEKKWLVMLWGLGLLEEGFLVVVAT